MNSQGPLQKQFENINISHSNKKPIDNEKKKSKTFKFLESLAQKRSNSSSSTDLYSKLSRLSIRKTRTAAKRRKQEERIRKMTEMLNETEDEENQIDLLIKRTKNQLNAMETQHN